MTMKMKEIFERNKMLIFIIGGILVTILCGVFISQSTKTQARRLENYVETAAADISVVEKERTDTLNLLFDVAKACANNENEAIKAIASSRQVINSNLQDGNYGAVQSEMENVKSNINVLVEAYPEISATQAYMEFMNACTIAESKIASHRENYNAAVREYNDFVDSVFNEWLLGLAGYRTKTLDLLDYGKEYEDPVDYNWEE